LESALYFWIAMAKVLHMTPTKVWDKFEPLNIEPAGTGVTTALASVMGRILIVCDDERRRIALVGMLAHCDVDAQVAAGGQEALERLSAFRADAIVVDLGMPSLDGVEMLRCLKERGDRIPAIALTESTSMEEALSAVHDLKAFWFLEKPVEPLAFRDLLERAISYKRSLQQSGEFDHDLSLRGVGKMAGSSPEMQQVLVEN
jgi:DNA-binding NtrC family response regulator